MTAPSESFESITAALKVAASALRKADIRFALGGSLAAWARGGPRPDNDLDLMVQPRDADAALGALEDAGMRTERPPEEWLYKAWHGQAMIDLIFHPSGVAVDDELLDRADVMPVMAVDMPVMTLEDVLVTKLSALDEHSLDYSGLLAIARSLREQIDWPQLRRRMSGSPYAHAFFALVEELGVAPAQARAQSSHQRRVRVLPDAG